MDLEKNVADTTVEFLRSNNLRVTAGVVRTTDTDSMHALIAIPFPNLRQLILTSPRISVPTFPCSDNWPNLQTLVLEGPSFNPSTGFPRLTRLVISQSSIGDHEELFDISDLLKFLSGCHDLRTVYFCLLGNIEVLDNWHGPPVHLDLLECFTSVHDSDMSNSYQTSVLVARILLEALVLPPACILRVGELCSSDVHSFANWLAPKDSPGPTHVRIAAQTGSYGNYLFCDKIPSVLSIKSFTLRTDEEGQGRASRPTTCDVRVFHL